jgi:hypothetical protein
LSSALQEPILDQPHCAPKCTGLHALRHFSASCCINRKEDGGLELPAKIVQARLGHASIVMAMDRYGHLFPGTDDGAETRTCRAGATTSCSCRRDVDSILEKTWLLKRLNRR